VPHLPYRDRADAGKALATRLKSSHRWRHPLVLALPRGGVPVAAEVAAALNADLDVLIVRKVGLPWQPEVAMGAIASGDVCIRNPQILRATRVSDDEFLEVVHQERRELARREQLYRGDRPLPSMAGRTVILVDDGLATGSTMRAAIAAVRGFHPAEVIVAVPVGAADSVAEMGCLAEEVICLATPEPFGAVGAFYDDFSQTSDEEVSALLKAAAGTPALPGTKAGREPETSISRTVTVHAGSTRLEGILSLPAGAVGLVLFAHGSGSSRLSPRNQYVAEVLHQGGLATLLFDLLTPEEERVDRTTRELRFDIGLLAARLAGAIDWALDQAATRGMKIGLFGASTGAAAALIAAACRPSSVQAVVSRGGRPDLAGDYLPQVAAPVLLIVGGLDTEVLALNEAALRRIGPNARLEIVPAATHLFDEPGTLERAARLACRWFQEKLSPPAGDRDRPDTRTLHEKDPDRR
jgi:putative phosphoribosyl transferase